MRQIHAATTRVSRAQLVDAAVMTSILESVPQRVIMNDWLNMNMCTGWTAVLANMTTFTGQTWYSWWQTNWCSAHTHTCTCLPVQDDVNR